MDNGSRTAAWIRDMYDQLSLTYGDSPSALGWYSRFTQIQRFWALTYSIHWDGQSVLDIGCGQGDLVGLMSQQGYKSTYTGIDLSSEMIRIAKKKYPQARFVIGDGLDFSCQERADIVLSSGILSHKWDDPEAYVKMAIQSMLDKSNDIVAFNVLSAKIPETEKDTHAFTYYSPPDILSWALDFSKNVEVRHHYLPNDMTVVLYKK